MHSAMTAELYWMADCWEMGIRMRKVLTEGNQKGTGMQYDIGYGVPGRKETGAIVLELDETGKASSMCCR